jgi:hypothetical protein
MHPTMVSQPIYVPFRNQSPFSCKMHFSSIHLRRNKRCLRSCLRSSVMNPAKCKKANVSNFSTANTEYTWEGHHCQLHLSLKMILKEVPKQTVPTHKNSTLIWVMTWSKN